MYVYICIHAFVCMSVHEYMCTGPGMIVSYCQIITLSGGKHIYNTIGLVLIMWFLLFVLTLFKLTCEFNIYVYCQWDHGLLIMRNLIMAFYKH